MDHGLRSDSQTANTSTATLVDPGAATSTLPNAFEIPHIPPDFTKRASEMTLHDAQSLGLRVLLPNPVRRTSFLYNPRLSIRHVGDHLSPLSPVKNIGSPPRPDARYTVDTSEQQEVFISYLRRPLLPAIHILLLLAHLGLSTAVPYLLVKHLIQPMILWLILVVCLVLQALYLAPGIVLEIIGMIRGRPIRSGWLQSGLHLTITILTLLPQSLSLFLLLQADQLPPCPSPWYYTPPLLPAFLAALPGSACRGLPAVVVLTCLNLVVMVLEVVITATAIGWDHRISLRENNRIAGERRPQLQQSETRSGKTKHRGVRRITRRWNVGVGTLLWEIEHDLVHRRHDHNHLSSPTDHLNRP